jgi:hypothetical protein
MGLRLGNPPFPPGTEPLEAAHPIISRLLTGVGVLIGLVLAVGIIILGVGVLWVDLRFWPF